MNSVELNKSQFNKISELVFASSGINLHVGKEELVKSRLMKRLKALGLLNFHEYIKFIENDRAFTELGIMVDFLTTNKTGFFREPMHFDFLKQHILPDLKGSKIRIWSAGCSSGEEPYTIAMVLKEALSDNDLFDTRILATDLSPRMVDTARNGVYSEDKLVDLPKYFLNKYFECIDNSKSQQSYQAKSSIKKLANFAKLNLIDSWPLKGPFNIIFCRNVMIYFNNETREKLVNRFWDLLCHGGYLFVGHSEGLSALSHKFQYVKPAIYVK